MIVLIKRLAPLLIALLTICRAGAQNTHGDHPKVLPSYTENFSDNKSYPAVCFDNAWQDGTGRLWLPTCPIVGIDRVFMFTFDGYDFRLVGGVLDKLKIGSKITTKWKDDVFCGLVGEEGGHSIFIADLGSQRIDYYALPDYRRRYEQVVINNDEPTVLSGLPRSWVISTLKDSILVNTHISKPIAITEAEKRNPDNGRICHYNGKEIWVGSQDSTWRYHLQSGKLSAYGMPQTSETGTRINIIAAGSRMFAVVFETASQMVFLLDAETDRFISPPQLTGRFQHVFIDVDSTGNVIINGADENDHRAWLITTEGEWLDYSAFFNPLGQARPQRVVSRDFQRDMIICHSGGILLHEVGFGSGIKHHLEDYSIRAMTHLSDDEVLITQQQPAHFVLNMRTQAIRPFESRFDISNRRFLEPVNGTRWVGGHNGFTLANTGLTEAIYAVPFERVTFLAMLDAQTLVVYSDKSGVYLFDLLNRKLTPLLIQGETVAFPERVHQVIVTDSTTIWGATSSGLWRVDLREETVRAFGTGDGFTDSRFLCIHQGDDGKLWLGTVVGGIQIFDPSTGEVTVLDNDHGLANNTVVSIEKDAEGIRWVGTYNGISLVSPEGGLIANLYPEDGVVHSENNRYASYVTREGKILIGSIAGLNLIDPRIVKERLQRRGELRIYPSLISYSTGMNELRSIEDVHDLENFGSIVLPAARRSIRFGFALSNFYDADNHQYSYMLQGRENIWRQVGNQHILEFNDLPAGDYILRVRGVDASGKASANELSIPFKAKAFFYEQWWFYPLCIAVITALALLWIFYLRAEVNRATTRIRRDKEIIEQQAEQLQELDKAKSHFFTNISHEFRTPLTIISGMSAQILEDPEIWAVKGAEMIRKNSGNLLELVNQILDLRKLEAYEMQLQLVQSDIVSYLRYLVESFRHYAQQQGKTLHFLNKPDKLIMDYDPDKVMQIVSNLISNAIKYTDEGTDIYVQVDRNQHKDREQCLLQIEDNGQGIAPDKLPFIFDRFYQAGRDDRISPGGTGIGLALTKELVHLMQGEIAVESKPGHGTRFSITLPVTRKAGVSTASIYQHPAVPHGMDTHEDERLAEPFAAVETDKPRVLVVEDNPDVMQFLTACLESAFSLLFASNGREGIDRALEEVPDLIVSDVMMPGVDGFELCDTLKRDTRTDHIPVILLTARADTESKLSGLKHGADEYLTKPFEPEELLLRLENLLAIRRSLQARYASFPAATDKAPSPQEAFIARLRDTVENNLDDTEFGVLQLCRTAGLGRTQLHGKLKALTGMSATIFIRHVRLNKARELLQTTGMNVSEVAYAVGFSDPRFFTRVYSEKFNEPPSRTRK